MKLRRNSKGYQFAELGPALIIIFIVILIPMLDMLYLSLAYASGWYCNHLVTREVACRDWNEPGPTEAKNDATTAWANTGLAKFIGAGFGDVSNTPNFLGGSPPTSVRVDTTVKVKPFLPIPFFMQVGGLNAPITFAYSAERPQEEKGLQ